MANLWVVGEAVELNVDVENIELVRDSNVDNSLLIVGVRKA